MMELRIYNPNNQRRNSTFSSKIITHHYRRGIWGKDSTLIESSTRMSAAENKSLEHRKKQIKNLSLLLQAELSHVQNIATTILNEQHFMTQQALEIFCCVIIQKAFRAYSARCFLKKLKLMRLISQRVCFRFRYYKKIKIRQNARRIIARQLFYYCYIQRKRRKAMYKNIASGLVTCITFTGVCRARIRIEYIRRQKQIFVDKSFESPHKRSKSSPVIPSFEFLLSPTPSPPSKTIRPLSSRSSVTKSKEFGVVAKELTFRNCRSISSHIGSKSVDSPTHLSNLLSKFDPSEPLQIGLLQDQEYTARLRSRTFSEIDDPPFPFCGVSSSVREISTPDEEIFRSKLSSDVDVAVPESNFACDVNSEQLTKHQVKVTVDGSSRHAPSVKDTKPHTGRRQRLPEAADNQRLGTRINTGSKSSESAQKHKSVSQHSNRSDKAASREKPHPPESAPSSKQQQRQSLLHSGSLKQPALPLNSAPRPSSTAKDKRFSSRNGVRILHSQPKPSVLPEASVEDNSSLYSMQFVDLDSGVVMEGPVEAAVSVLTDGFLDAATSLSLSVVDTEDFLITRGVAPNTPPAPNDSIRLPDIQLAMEMVSLDRPQVLFEGFNYQSAHLSQSVRLENSVSSIFSTLPSIVDEAEQTVVDNNSQPPVAAKASVPSVVRPKSRGAVARPRSKGRKLFQRDGAHIQ
jgi:hypothetical protein